MNKLLPMSLDSTVTYVSGPFPPRSVIEKFAAMQMLDVHIPTTDGRELVLTVTPSPSLS
jgi:hypothetical protein